MPGIGHSLLSEVTALSYLLVFGPVQSLPDLDLVKGPRFKALLADMVYIAKLKRCTYTSDTIQKNIQTTCPRLQKAP